MRWWRNTRRSFQAAGWRGVAAQAAALAGGPAQRLTVRRADLRHPLHLRVPSTDVVAFHQIFVRREYDFAVRASPRAIVDAGANVGYASVYFANRFPDARIVAIEPERSNFQVLEDNVRPYPNVIAVRAALWNCNGRIALTDPGLGHWGFVAAAQAATATDHDVPALTIDCLLDLYALPRIDILKLDIEGAEREVCADSEAWIDRVDAIVAELHEHMKPGCLRSFYRGTRGLEHEWRHGENIVLARTGSVLEAPAGER
ncbi:MAG: FkbM family methyltransferase [Burkholderiales bacterium]|jgi:FkbM family methyltransferase|nr:FkbM family methyltransferase [Burkholderiales bacterium]